ncbi:MAG: F0F1 ATP synthase subunit gamma [Pseudomonadota bacterium]|nr:F0F1 ATP synthase subunit gamma [Pseudomonadota bacterium]MDO7710391.1 F0F1 ATP synthase subunit gamma [Pseudomonadota bacterium]
MSDGVDTLQHRIDGAVDLQTVVRTMKALSAGNIGQYEKAVTALAAYDQTVELGLIACLHQPDLQITMAARQQKHKQVTGVIVFGSDQGLVGQFNDLLAEFVQESLKDELSNIHIWAVGERMADQLEEAGLSLSETFNVPNSIHGITALVEQLLIASESACFEGDINQLYIFHNGASAKIGGYQTLSRRLLPFDELWQHKLRSTPWQTNNLPETLGNPQQTLQALIREYLFVSLFRACAESLASENGSRLATMQRAEKNIGDMLDELTQTYHQLRQENIDTELFDLIAGFTS